MSYALLKCRVIQCTVSVDCNPRLACSWNAQGSCGVTDVDTFEAQAATTTEDRSIIQISISAPDSGPQEFAGK
jgi:hypothetical protein